MMGKLQTEEGKMNVSGQVYEEPLTFQCGAHISRQAQPPGTLLLTSWNLIMTPLTSTTTQRKRSFIDFDACEKKNK